jgi:hypothetical protein
MACCGRKRQQISRGIPVQQASNPALPGNSSRSPRTTAFQYLGKTALTAVGPVSGRHYRFNYPGAILEVDPRDQGSLATDVRPSQRDYLTGVGGCRDFSLGFPHS